MIAKYKKIIFDLDGTLIDVFQCYYKLHKICCEKIDAQSLTFDQYKNMKSNGFSEYMILKNLFRGENKILEDLLNWRTNSIEKKEFIRLHDLKPNVTELLSELKDANIDLYLATFRQDRYNLIWQLNELGLHKFFNKILCRGDFDNYFDKTKSRILTEGLPNLDRCCMVGDTLVDFETARELSIDCILLTDGLRSGEYFLKRNINVTFAKINDVRSAFFNVLPTYNLEN